MAVAVDATGTALINGTTAATSFNYTGITVGASLSNGALIFILILGGNAAHTSATCTWDSGGTNQSMFFIGSNTVSDGTFNETVLLFGLLNPTSGNKTLAVSWTGSDYSSSCAISLTGVNQTSNAAAFTGFTSAVSTTAGNKSITVTSATGDMVIAGMVNAGAIASVNNTQIWLDSTSANGPVSAANRAAGAATVTMTGNTFGAFAGVVAGFDVVAAGAGGDVLFAQIWM